MEGIPARGQRRTQAARREEAERRILTAAMRIVAEQGLDALTLADAGEAAGYSRGLPIHYFGSKADLLAAIAELIREEFFAGLKERMQERRGIANLIAGIDYYFDACRTDPTMIRALHTVLGGALHKPALAETVARLNRDSAASIEAALRGGIKKGEIRRDLDVHAWSVLVLASVRGVIAQWLVDPEHVDLTALRNGFIEAMRRAFAP
jgi:AcrR family transcriptional regulator